VALLVLEDGVAFLIVESGTESGRRVDLTGSLVIGRQAKVGLSIQDAKASREHTRIEQAAGSWAVIDLESRNGTLLNGRKIAREFLNPGDRITIGQTVFRFEMADASPTATTRPMKEGRSAPLVPGMPASATPATYPAACMTPPLAPSPMAATPPPAAIPIPAPPVAPGEPKAPKLRYQDQPQGVGIVTLLICAVILIGLVIAAKYLGQSTINRIMNERKSGQQQP